VCVYVYTYISVQRLMSKSAFVCFQTTSLDTESLSVSRLKASSRFVFSVLPLLRETLVCVYVYIHVYLCTKTDEKKCFCLFSDYYGLATISWLLKIIGLFCKRAL